MAKASKGKASESKQEPVIMQGPKLAVRVTNADQITPGGVISPRTKVAIVGFAPSSMTDVKAYFGDPNFEIWGINQLYISFPMIVQHATRWFQIHSRTEYNMALRDHNHHGWLAGSPPTPHENRFPIYMQVKEPDIPMSISFPKDAICDMFGRYFTNSISWEIALAIYETVKAREQGMTGFTDIHVYGVDMSTDAEYREQRPSCEYFIGWARALGINVFIPNKSDLCKTLWLYPFEDESPFRQKIDGRRQELRNRLQGLAAQEQQSHDERVSVLGALENMNYIEQTWCFSKKELQQLEGQGPKPAEEAPACDIEIEV